MVDNTPEWLLVMRTITGMTETPGPGDNPKILAMRDEIARRYPEMQSYCNLYKHDETPWCGLTVAYCMAMAGIRPVFGTSDTDKWMWALAWSEGDDARNFGLRLDAPRPGCVITMKRSGGGHVTLYESTEGSYYVCRGGNQSDRVNTAKYPISDVVALVWPQAGGSVPPASTRRTLMKGDEGLDVMALQRSLGIPADGDFGNQTDTQVRAFQSAAYVDVDGVVGPQTWGEVDKLDTRMANGSDGIPKELADKVREIADESEISEYSWNQRGYAPPGYIAGVAQTFAVAVLRFINGDNAMRLAAQPETGNDADALTYLKTEFTNAGMNNSRMGLDTLRHVFVLLMGLGMRESTGNYSCGRDQSAGSSSMSSDTCEAGAWQTSWNMSSASQEIDELMREFWTDPNGFLPTYSEGLNPSPANLQVAGSGEGARYQFLAKYSPAFAALVTVIGLRLRRSHWGPVNKKAVELRPEADEMLKDVQMLVESYTPEVA